LSAEIQPKKKCG